MIDLSNYKSFSHAIVDFGPHDTEDSRSDDPSKWSKGLQIFYAITEGIDLKVQNRNREITIPGSQRDRVLSITPIAPNRVLLLFQMKDQADADRKREADEVERHMAAMETVTGHVDEGIEIPDDPVLVRRIEELINDYWRSHGN